LHAKKRADRKRPFNPRTGPFYLNHALRESAI